MNAVAVSWIVARKEWTEMMRDGRVRIGFVGVLTLLLLSTSLGWQAWRETERTRTAARDRDREIWLNQGPDNPHTAAHFGRYLFKPVSPLSFLERGLDGYLGIALRVEAHRRTPARNRPSEDATVLARFGELTAATVMQILVPLLLVLLLFPAFAGERESGTLRYTLSLGVSRTGLALGKLLGGSLVFLILFVPVSAAGALALQWNAAAQSGFPVQQGTARLALLSAGYLAYFAIFGFVCLTFSALARSSPVALVTLLSFWAVATLIAPRLASEVASRIFPAPSMQAFTEAMSREMAEGINGHDPADKRLESLRNRVLAENEVSRVEDLPFNFDAIVLQAGEEYGNQVLDKHYGRLWRLYEEQLTAQRGFSWMSPLVALRPYSMALAGTDLGTHRDFSEQAEAFRRNLVRFLNNYLEKNSRTGDWHWRAGPDLWPKAPDFRYESSPLQRALDQMGPDAAVLSIWLAVSALAASLAASQISAGGS
jgi:ABC-2 type transport system permease protein